MKLHVLFEYLPKEIASDDVYFTTDALTAQKLAEQGCLKVELSKIVFKDDSGEFAETSRDFFSQLPEKLTNIENDVFSRMLQPILFVLDEIEKVLCKYGITDIVLYRGSREYFLAAEKSEGESGGTWLYYRSWMFNQFIYEYFIDKRNVVWNKKEGKIKAKLVAYVRYFILYYATVIGLLRDLKVKSNANSIMIQQNKEVMIGTVWVKQQYKHLRSFLDSSAKYKAIYVGTPAISDSNYVQVECLNLDEIVRVLKETKTVIKCVPDATIYFRNSKFSIDKKITQHALGRTYLAYASNYIRYQKTIQSLSKKYCVKNIVNNKTWNWTQSIDKNIAEELSIPKITLQSVMLPDVVYPNKTVFKKVFVSSKQQYVLFKKSGMDVHLYSGYSIVQDVKRYAEGELIVSIFLQSDMYEDVSLRFVEQIVANVNSLNGVKIIIKPHYRQNKATLNQITSLIASSRNIMLSSADEEASSIIKASHICISFTSAVLFEAACAGITPVSGIIDNTIADIVLKSEKLADDAILKYRDVGCLLNDLKKPEEMIHRFADRRKSYFESLFGEELGIDEIV